MSGHGIYFRSIIYDTPSLGQQGKGCCLKIVLLNFTKLSLKFQLTEI